MFYQRESKERYRGEWVMGKFDDDGETFRVTNKSPEQTHDIMNKLGESCMVVAERNRPFEIRQNGKSPSVTDEPKPKPKTKRGERSSRRDKQATPRKKSTRGGGGKSKSS